MDRIYCENSSISDSLRSRFVTVLNRHERTDTSVSAPKQINGTAH